MYSQMLSSNEKTIIGGPSRSGSTSTVDTVLGSTASEFNAMKRQLFKTKMCRHFLNGKCKYNEECTFSHDTSELLIRKDMAKTKLCKKSNCIDTNCSYAHSFAEIRAATDQLCPSWLRKGSCIEGSRCRFSHNSTYLEELAVASKPKSGHALFDRNTSWSVTGSRSTSPEINTPTVSTDASAADLVQTLINLLSATQLPH